MTAAPDCADILRAVDRLNSPARDIGKDLAGDVREGAAADEANGLRGLYLLILCFEEPAKMSYNALDNGADELGFACFEADVEEHSSGVRILKRAAICREATG